MRFEVLGLLVLPSACLSPDSDAADSDSDDSGTSEAADGLEAGDAAAAVGTAGWAANEAHPEALEWRADAAMSGIVNAQVTPAGLLDDEDPFGAWILLYVSPSSSGENLNVWVTADGVAGDEGSTVDGTAHFHYAIAGWQVNSDELGLPPLDAGELYLFNVFSAGGYEEAGTAYDLSGFDNDNPILHVRRHGGEDEGAATLVVDGRTGATVHEPVW